MAPSKNKLSSNTLGKNNKKAGFVEKYLNYNYLKSAIFDPHSLLLVCVLIFIFEIVLNVFIIENVSYTEIDWKAYMQEVQYVLNGTLDYKLIKGDTGPLVYPAGFVYIYTLFYYITSKGANIYLGQYIFLVLYLIQTVLFQRILWKTCKIPPYALLITTLTSYRIHSIFVLRLFNDPIAVILFYISLNLFLSGKWTLGSIFYSLAVSVKMNILLYAPCLFIAYLTNLTYAQTIYNLFICGFIQLLLGSPFLLTFPISYVKGSFDLGRIFEHKWTVNYRFLPRYIFEDYRFHFALLTLHVLLLLAFVPLLKRYLSSYAKLNVVVKEFRKQVEKEKTKRKNEDKKLNRLEKKFLDSFEQQLQGKHNRDDNDFLNDSKFDDKLSKISQLFILPFFITNLIGMACARSLHYQFYCWYFHSLLYLVYSTNFKVPFKFLLLGLIEYCWNVYPSTYFSSGLLHVCHIILIYGVYKCMKS